MGLFTREPVPPDFSSLEDGESLRNFVAQTREAIYVTNARGRIVAANPACLRMFGVSSVQQLCAYGAADLLAQPEIREEELTLVNRDGYVREFELLIRRPDGHIRTVLDSCCKCVNPSTGEILYRGILVDISDRKETESHLANQNIRDPLTGCYNRRWLKEFEQRMLGVGWGCIAVDIDHFKAYNDTKGHDAGDAALLKVGSMLLRHTRADEGVVRMGGDEFVVLLQGAAPISVQKVAERLRHFGANESPVPFSIGWATREGNESLEMTLTRADHNMYGKRRLERGEAKSKHA